MSDDVLGLVITLLLLALFVGAFVLPIAALVVSINTRRKLNELSQRQPAPPEKTTEAGLSGLVQQLTVRVARLEAGIDARPAPSAPAPTEATTSEADVRSPVREPELPPPPQPVHAPAPAAPMPPPIVARPIDAASLESVIGRRLLGWAAVALIVFATAFFLKYAFDNRWIGELGRVAIGVAAGIALTALGYRFHKRRWGVFSQILTGGGVAVLYLSAYASFAYYHLASQKAAFVYLTILIAEAAALALLYDAPAIAVMALIGGFLTPVLLHSNQNQYQVLFGYIFALDIATLAFLKRWWGMSSLAFAGTHLLFWLWCLENYERPKLGAVMVFQTVVFFAFLVVRFAQRLLKKGAIEFDDLATFGDEPLAFITKLESLFLLLANAFVYFATAYWFLNPDYHRWMGPFALGMAILYAAIGKLLVDRHAITRSELLFMISVALTFVTLAVPIQWHGNWITIAWAIEGLLILFAGVEKRSQWLRAMAHCAFALALLKLFFWDSPFGDRGPFTPLLNQYFLSSLFVTACLFAAAIVYEKLGERKQIAARVFQIVLVVVALITLWWIMTIEVQTYFAGRALREGTSEGHQHERWLGQMTLSVLWSIYAAVLAAVGFIRRRAAVRWASLSLFALTVVKVMLIDIAVLEQLYRIIAFLVLGTILLLVTWGYHRAFYSKESSR